MSAFARKYSDEQRDAVIEARLDRGLTASKVCALAKQGSLTLGGRVLEPFEIVQASVYSIAKDELRKRGRRVETVPYMDRLSALQDRALAAAEYELGAYEKAQKRGKPNPETLRQIVRVLREAKALGSPEERRTAPGHHNPEAGKVEGGQTRGGLGASILAAGRKTPQNDEEEPATEQPTVHTTLGDNGTENTNDGGERGQTSAETEDETAPGSLQRASLARATTTA